MPEASAITKIVLHFGTFIYYFPVLFNPLLTFFLSVSSLHYQQCLFVQVFQSTHVHTVLLFICIIVALFCLCFTCLSCLGDRVALTLFWPIKFCGMATRHFPRLRAKF